MRLRLRVRQNTDATGLRSVSHPGLSRQDARLGGQREQVKSITFCQTKRGKQTPKGCGELSVTDQFVVVKMSLKDDGAKGLTCLVEMIIDNW